MTESSISCIKCNNRLTKKDIELIDDMSTAFIAWGGKFTKEEWIAIRRLRALKVGKKVKKKNYGEDLGHHEFN